MLALRTMIRRLVFSLSLGAVCCASAAAASAQDPELPPLAVPGQWNYVTLDNAASSSRCIGNPVTAMCAVETLLACFQRGDMTLCRLVDDGTEQYAQVFAAPEEPGKYLAYRVLAARVVGADPIPGQPNAHPGDVLLTIDQREGVLGRYAGPTGAPASDFLLRRRGDGTWKIAAWGDQGDPTPVTP